MCEPAVSQLITPSGAVYRTILDYRTASGDWIRVAQGKRELANPMRHAEEVGKGPVYRESPARVDSGRQVIRSLAWLQSNDFVRVVGYDVTETDLKRVVDSMTL